MRELLAVLIAIQPVTADASPALIALQRAGIAAGRFLDKPFERIRMTRVHAEARLRCFRSCRKSVKSINRPVKYGQARLRRLGRVRSKKLVRCMNACKL